MSGDLTKSFKRILLSGHILIAVYLVGYVTVSINSFETMKDKGYWLQDLRYYERAVNETFQGPGPYAVLSIGPGFFYPPPSLLLIESIKAIKNEETKVRVVIALNALLLGTMIWGLIRHFRLSHVATWYWYVLGLCYSPFLESAYLGQINIIPMLGLAALFLFMNRRWFIAGTGLAIATLSKVSPGIFLVYLLACRQWKVVVGAALGSIALCVITALRYGISPFIQYPGVLQWLSLQVPLGVVPQSFEARMVWLEQITVIQPNSYGWAAPLVSYCHNNFLHQRGLTYYLCGVLALTSLFLFRSREELSRSFVIFTLAMMLAPNVMWYHHYTFMLLPLFIWMGDSKLSKLVVSWCLLGLFVTQIDRHGLTHGILIHLFGHLSIIAILASQAFRFGQREIPPKIK